MSSCYSCTGSCSSSVTHVCSLKSIRPLAIQSPIHVSSKISKIKISCFICHPLIVCCGNLLCSVKALTGEWYLHRAWGQFRRLHLWPGGIIFFWWDTDKTCGYRKSRGGNSQRYWVFNPPSRSFSDLDVFVIWRLTVSSSLSGCIQCWNMQPWRSKWCSSSGHRVCTYF